MRIRRKVVRRKVERVDVEARCRVKMLEMSVTEFALHVSPTSFLRVFAVAHAFRVCARAEFGHL